MLTAPELKTLLAARRLRLTKRLGQHHLVDSATAQRVVAAGGLSPETTVVEIGAGLGALTEPLAAVAGRVIAVEVDRPIAALLAERMQPHRNVTVVCQDILTYDWVPAAAAGPVWVVGAIPYHITSPILVALSEHRAHIAGAVLVLQDEVARRLIARPGTKAYGRLSVLAQYGWELTAVFPVSRRAFFPQPAVDSACLRLLPRRQPAVAVVDQAAFFEVVKAAFAHRRKTLANCLNDTCIGGRTVRGAAELVRSLGWPAAVRGETLSLEQFAALANRLAA